MKNLYNDIQVPAATIVGALLPHLRYHAPQRVIASALGTNQSAISAAGRGSATLQTTLDILDFLQFKYTITITHKKIAFHNEPVDQYLVRLTSGEIQFPSKVKTK